MASDTSGSTNVRSIEDLLDDFEEAVKQAAYSDSHPMGDPGNYYKHMERDEAHKALMARLAPEPAGTASFNVTRYKVVQDKGEYCLKGCPDGDLVDFSAYAALLNRCNTPTKAGSES